MEVRKRRVLGANSEHVMTRLESKVRETCIFGAFCLTYLLEWLGIKTRRTRSISRALLYDFLKNKLLYIYIELYMVFSILYMALFSSFPKKFCNTVALSFVCGNYCSIID